MAITENCGTVKEQTIRVLVAECQKAQTEIWTQLEREFDRHPDSECKASTGKPSCPNVLDEIADSLKELNEAQKRTISFIVNNINSKL